MAKRTTRSTGAEAARDRAAGQKPRPAADAPTPVMAQYLEIKAANPDCLLFYRMGDFYELFFADAEVASRTLGIALTKRGRHLGEDIPMCGVPVRAADEYLQKLIRAEHRVAVCEQMEDPAEAKKRGHKAVVRREVVRLVTPGTITEEALLDSRANNFLTALFRAPSSTTAPGDNYALASLDISTGEFLLSEVSGTDMAGELSRLGPGEIVAGDELAADPEIRALADQIGAALTPVPRAYFDSLGGERALRDKLGVAEISAFGDFTRPELATAGALLKYVELTQIGKQPLLRPPKRMGPSDVLMIDAATRANLELVSNSHGERRGSLLHALDRSVTGAGARALAGALASPLTDTAAIGNRLDTVQYLLEKNAVRAELRTTLKGCPDLARALARLTLGRGGPRDLGAIRDGLGGAGQARKILSGDTLPVLLRGVKKDLGAPPDALPRELGAALSDEIPAQLRDGGFVRTGYSKDLDDARALRDKSRRVIAGLQNDYVQATGVKALKIRHNNVLGYFIEVPAAHGGRLMGAGEDNGFIHRQTMASAMRFTTLELGQTESKIAAASDRAQGLEQEIFDDLASRVSDAQGEIGDAAAAGSV